MFGRVLSARLVISGVASPRPVPGQLKWKLGVDLPDVDAPHACSEWISFAGLSIAGASVMIPTVGESKASRN